MCGRFTLTEKDLVRLARALGAVVDPALAATWRPRFNVAPGQDALLVRDAGGLRLERARFGIGGGGGPLRFNARSETAAEKRSFRAAWATRRCAVPADGFYEWEGPARGRRPIWFHGPLPSPAARGDGGPGTSPLPSPAARGDGGPGTSPLPSPAARGDGGPGASAPRPLLFAALYEAEEGGRLAFTILTARARGPVAALHDRMPVLVSDGALRSWLAGGPLPAPAPEDALVGAPASPRVNAVANDDEGCLAPPQARQLTLL